MLPAVHLTFERKYYLIDPETGREGLSLCFIYWLYLFIDIIHVISIESILYYPYIIYICRGTHHYKTP